MQDFIRYSNKKDANKSSDFDSSDISNQLKR